MIMSTIVMLMFMRIIWSTANPKNVMYHKTVLVATGVPADVRTDADSETIILVGNGDDYTFIRLYTYKIV